jgi:predicted GNAT family acetyltransferase
MRVERFDAARSFLDAAGGFLTAREAEHCLLLGISSDLIGGRVIGDSDPYFCAVRNVDRVVAAAVRTPPFNLVLSMVDNPKAIEAIASDVKESFGSLPGIVGPKQVTAEFAAIWSGKVQTKPRVAMAERIFRCDAVMMPPRVPGEMQLATTRDEQLLAGWLKAFTTEAVRDMPASTDEEVLAHVRQRIEHRSIYIWRDVEPVSVAGFTGRTPNGIRIGPVYTPPEFRQRGYASALVAELTDQLLSSVKFCFLFTDLSNPTSNSVYQRMGYRSVIDVDQYAFD